MWGPSDERRRPRTKQDRKKNWIYFLGAKIFLFLKNLKLGFLGVVFCVESESGIIFSIRAFCGPVWPGKPIKMASDGVLKSSREWIKPKFFCCHLIEHPKKTGKRILHHELILYIHKITSVQSFRVFRYYPSHNSAEPGPIPINLESIYSWPIAFHFFIST